jgi:hypothetical protein
MESSADNDDFTDDITKWNIYKIINYIKVHYIQFLLLILVGFIIYVIDHISNINAVLFGLPSSVPGINQQPLQSKLTRDVKKINKNKSKSKK